MKRLLGSSIAGLSLDFWGVRLQLPGRLAGPAFFMTCQGLFLAPKAGFSLKLSR